MAIGRTGDPPGVTAAVARGSGVGLPAGGAALGVAIAAFGGVVDAVVPRDDDAPAPVFGVEGTGLIEGLCVGRGVGRRVGRGVEVGGGGVAAWVTVMLPCIAA